MKNNKTLGLALALAALVNDAVSVAPTNDQRPVPYKSATLTPKAWKKKKKATRASKNSRRKNRG